MSMIATAYAVNISVTTGEAWCELEEIELLGKQTSSAAAFF